MMNMRIAFALAVALGATIVWADTVNPPAFIGAPDHRRSVTQRAITLPPSRRMTINLGYGDAFTDSSWLRVPVVANAALFDGVKFDVTVDGAPLPNGFTASVWNVNGTLVAGFGRSGLTFILR